MFISLLDVMMRQKGSGSVLGRLPSSGEELRNRAGGGGTLGPIPERSGGVLGDLPRGGDLRGGTMPQGGAGSQGLVSHGPAPSPQGLPSPQPAAQPQGGPQVGGQLQGQGQQPRPDGSRRREPGPGENGQSFLSRLFNGELSAGERQALGEDGQRQLLRRGLLTAGLTMLGSNVNGRGFGEVLARGIFAAQQDSAQTAGELLDTRNAQIRLARRANVFDNPELSEVEKWQEVRRISAKEGDTEAVKQATDVIEQFRELEAGEAEARFQNIQTPNGTITALVQEMPDGSVQLRNPITKEVLDERDAPPVDEGERINRINSLADDFRSEAGGLIEAQRFADNAESAPASAAGDQTLVVTLNKLLDPNSTVREGEFTRVAKIGGFTGEAQQLANRILSEGELGEQARQSIRQEIERLRQANAQELQSVGEFYRRRAMDAGVDPRLVVRSAFMDQSGGGVGSAANQNTDEPPEDPFSGPPPGQGGN